MYSKETVLNDSYQELSDCLLDLCKYEMVGVQLEEHIFALVTNMVNNTQYMIDNIDKFEWSDVMKVRQTNYTVIRMINTVLINQYDKILSHKQR